MNEIQNGLEPKQSPGKRQPVEWKIVSVQNEKQTVTVLFPAQQEEGSQKAESEVSTKA